jgi:hypothetical protein
MTQFLLAALLLLSAGMVGWGMSRKDRLFQYPSLVGMAYAAYICPASIGLYLNRDLIPTAAQEAGAIERLLLMLILCAVATVGGFAAVRPTRKARPVHLSVGRLFTGGVCLSCLGLAGYAGLARLSGGLVAYFSSSGNYALEWRGLPVVFAFLVNFIYPGVVLCSFAVIRQPTAFRVAFVGVVSLLPLASAWFLARRGPFVYLLASWGLAAFFAKSWVPSRLVATAVLVVGGAWLILAPQYRGLTFADSDLAQVADISVKGEIKSYVTGKGQYLPTTDAAVVMAAHSRAELYGWGRALYNQFIEMVVPRQVVGEAAKSSLKLEAPDSLFLCASEFDYHKSAYTSVLGPADAFREFWYFGVVFYFALSATAKMLWARATLGRSVRAAIYYAVLVPLLLLTTTSEISYLLPMALWTIMFLAPLLWWAREAPPRRAEVDRSRRKPPVHGGDIEASGVQISQVKTRERLSI